MVFCLKVEENAILIKHCSCATYLWGGISCGGGVSEQIPYVDVLFPEPRENSGAGTAHADHSREFRGSGSLYTCLICEFGT